MINQNYFLGIIAFLGIFFIVIMFSIIGSNLNDEYNAACVNNGFDSYLSDNHLDYCLKDGVAYQFIFEPQGMIGINGEFKLRKIGK